MAILDENEIATRAARRARFRVRHVGTKLSIGELRKLESLVEQKGTTQGELIRGLILEELARDDEEPEASLELTEITALRLLVTNLLRPLTTGQKLTPETFDGIVAEVKKRKRIVASELRLDLERA